MQVRVPTGTATDAGCGCSSLAASAPPNRAQLWTVSGSSVLPDPACGGSIPARSAGGTVPKIQQQTRKETMYPDDHSDGDRSQFAMVPAAALRRATRRNPQKPPLPYLQGAKQTHPGRREARLSMRLVQGRQRRRLGSATPRCLDRPARGAIASRDNTGITAMTARGQECGSTSPPIARLPLATSARLQLPRLPTRGNCLRPITALSPSPSSTRVARDDARAAGLHR